MFYNTTRIICVHAEGKMQADRKIALKFKRKTHMSHTLQSPRECASNKIFYRMDIDKQVIHRRSSYCENFSILS